jgi:hypothetical protein
MAEMEDEIYGEFEITDRESFENAAKELSKTDNEIKLIYQGIREDLANACNGVKMAMNVPLAEHITAETTLTVYKSMVYSILMQLNEFVSKWAKENGGNINTFDEEFNIKLSETLNPEKVKKDFMKLYNYDYSDVHHENLIYATAIKEFSKKDPKYDMAVKKIDQMNNEMLKLHLMPGQNYEDLKAKIEDIMVVGIELTKPLIEIAPDAEEILKKKQEEELAKKTEEDNKKELAHSIENVLSRSTENIVAEPEAEVQDKDEPVSPEEPKPEDVVEEPEQVQELEEVQNDEEPEVVPKNEDVEEVKPVMIEEPEPPVIEDKKYLKETNEDEKEPKDEEEVKSEPEEKPLDA